MLNWFRHLDDLLRGERTKAELLGSGQINLPLRVFVLWAIVLGMSYGFFMGWFALAGRKDQAWEQMLASTVKLPALFLLTLIVTFPSLYVFNALVGCRLRFAAAMRLLVAAIVVNLAVGASLGPILGFFTLSTTSYPFMIVLNVVLLGIAGFIGLMFLLKTLKALAMSSVRESVQELIPKGDADDQAAVGDPQAAATVRRREDLINERLAAAALIFRIWLLIYALVGAQMGWLLRPFIGHPDLTFSWFRAREGNFFLGVFSSLRQLFGA